MTYSYNRTKQKIANVHSFNPPLNLANFASAMDQPFIFK